MAFVKKLVYASAAAVLNADRGTSEITAAEGRVFLRSAVLCDAYAVKNGIGHIFVLFEKIEVVEIIARNRRAVVFMAEKTVIEYFYDVARAFGTKEEGIAFG